MRITRDIVIHTADLARLDLEVLGEPELELLRGQLDAILSHVEQLDELDTSGVEPTTHAVPIAIPLRADQPVEGPGREAILSNAPAADAGYFTVPRIIAE